MLVCFNWDNSALENLCYQGRCHQSGWSGFNLTTKVCIEERGTIVAQGYMSLFQQRQENSCSFNVSSVQLP